MDREKAIKALEHCKDNQHVNDCNECEYGGKTGMFCIRMIDDVVAMLKEQDAKPDKCIICEGCGHKLQDDWNWCPWCRWETKRGRLN